MTDCQPFRSASNHYAWALQCRRTIPRAAEKVQSPDGIFTTEFVAEFNPDVANCTGRFANVTGGSVIMYAVSEPFFILGATTTPFEYSWQERSRSVSKAAGTVASRHARGCTAGL
jgi:hypothetical protein